jgi:CO/xanthine dehydrogenase FAD-binding subunit
VCGAAGTQTIAAHDFFLGPMMAAIPTGAIVTELRFPAWTGARIGVAFHEVSTRQSDFALAAAAAQVSLDADGRCLACAIGIGAATPVPTRLDAVAEELIGSTLIDSVEITVDTHASSDYRRRAARALALRAIVEARDAALAGARSRA